MKAKNWIVLVLLALLVFYGCEQDPVSITRIQTLPDDSEYAAEIEEALAIEINRYRQNNDRTRLRSNSSLQIVAQDHCIDMLVRNFYSSTNPDGLTAEDRVEELLGRPATLVRENLAHLSSYPLDNAEVVAETVVAYWNSRAVYKENLLEDITHMGCGVGINDCTGGIYVTLLLVTY